MGLTGIEPALPKERDPKSRVSANFTTAPKSIRLRAFSRVLRSGVVCTTAFPTYRTDSILTSPADTAKYRGVRDAQALVNNLLPRPTSRSNFRGVQDRGLQPCSMQAESLWGSAGPAAEEAREARLPRSGRQGPLPELFPGLPSSSPKPEPRSLLPTRQKPKKTPSGTRKEPAVSTPSFLVGCGLTAVGKTKRNVSNASTCSR